VSNQSQAQTDFSLAPSLSQSTPTTDEQLQHERTLLVASAAHELKTPLAVIAGFSDFLLGDHAGPLNPQQKSVITEIQQNTLRLQRLVQSFLKFSALESGKFEIRKELRNINQCVAEAISQWRIPYMTRGITCEFFPDPTLELAAVDSVKLQNIICNLLDNALKFTPPFGRVQVTTKNDLWERRNSAARGVIHLERRDSSGRSRNNCIRIDVTDNGPGIPPEYHREIFEDFRQLEQNGQTQGIGLGLAIARRLAEAHGGKVIVESVIGQGSTFSVFLPTQ
jgi:signal transduction histidine kinase